MERRQGRKFRCGRKTLENYSKENLHHQEGTENPIYKVPPAGFETGVSSEVEGEGKKQKYYVVEVITGIASYIVLL